MSKAFTKEDDQPEDLPPRPLPTVLPPGAKNYLTPHGAARFKAELDALVARGRPGERIQELRRILDSGVIVGPPSDGVDVVRFGATVSVHSLPGGETARYRIVGVDETDLARGWISWVTPVAKALLSAAAGDRVRVALPSGEKELEILDVTYEAAP
jgi:transcription elongation factor GreB